MGLYDGISFCWSEIYFVFMLLMYNIHRSFQNKMKYLFIYHENYILWANLKNEVEGSKVI